MNDFGNKRLESRIAEAISTMILKGEVKNPHLSHFISIHKVIVSKDTAYAHVFVSTFEDDLVLQNSVIALNSAAGFMQSKIAKILKTKNTPKLSFHADTSIREGMRVNKIIEDLNSEHE